MSGAVMRFCAACNDYTLRDVCPRCGGPAKPNRPAKYSPEDHYGEYRRRLKTMDAGERAAAAFSSTGTPPPPPPPSDPMAEASPAPASTPAPARSPSAAATAVPAARPPAATPATSAPKKRADAARPGG